MSSATSIERLRRERGPASPGSASPESASADKEGFRPWHFFVLVSLVGATVAVLMARQPAPEHLVLLSLTIGAAGVCGAALYSTLVPLVRKDDAAIRAPLSERTRAALEREKMLVLRSIKELEFDRAMGKMSPADFDELAGRLRTRALALMKQLDDLAPVYRARIEQELAARLEQPAPSAQACACGTSNDTDAVFCKRCGTRLRPSAEERLRPERGAKRPSESERGWGPASTEERLRPERGAKRPSESERGWGPASTE